MIKRKAVEVFLSKVAELSTDFVPENPGPLHLHKIEGFSDESLSVALRAAFREMYGDRHPVGVCESLGAIVVVCNDGAVFQYTETPVSDDIEDNTKPEFFWQELESVPGTIEAGGRE